MKDDHIIWIVLAVIMGYIFFTDGSWLADKIKFIILNNFLFVLIIIAVIIFYNKK